MNQTSVLATNRTPPGEFSRLEDKLMFFFVCISLALSGYLIFFLTGFGYDITDEGFYLISARSPLQYQESATQFGYITNILWRLSTENIFYFRVLGALTLYLSAWFFLFSAAAINVGNTFTGRKAAAQIATLLSPIGLYSYSNYLFTPSYNLVNLVALLLVSASLLQITGSLGSKHYRSYLLLGIGGYLSFMGKRSSAALLGLVVGLWVLYAFFSTSSRKNVVTGVLVSVSSAFLLLFLSAIDIAGAVQDFVSNFSAGIRHGETMLGNTTSASLILWRPGAIKNSSYVLYAYLPLFFGGLFVVVSHVNTKNRNQYFVLICLSLIVITLCTLGNVFWNILQIAHSKEILLFQLATFAGVVLTVVAKSDQWPVLDKSRLLVIFVIITLMPYIYTFGTGNTYVGTISRVPVFGVGAVVLIVCAVSNTVARIRVLVLFGAWVLMLSCLAFHNGVQRPYRQPTIENIAGTYPYVSADRYIPSSLKVLKDLKLASEFETYIRKFVEDAKKQGWKSHNNIIDLTGASPGILFAFGAKSPGSGWHLGGYPGSIQRLVESLGSLDSNEINSAWLLVEKNWRRSIPIGALKELGISEEDYSVAATGVLPKGYGGRSFSNIQLLLKPNSIK